MTALLTVGLQTVHAARDWPLIWSLIGAAAALTVVGLLLLVRRR